MASIRVQKKALSHYHDGHVTYVDHAFTYTGSDQANIAYMVMSAACAFEMDPITISGGTADSQATAIREALSLGFIAITVVPPDNYAMGTNAAYERIVHYAHAIRDMKLDPKSILEAYNSYDQPSLSKAVDGIVRESSGQNSEVYRGVSSLYGNEGDAVSASSAFILQM